MISNFAKLFEASRIYYSPFQQFFLLLAVIATADADTQIAIYLVAFESAVTAN